MIPFVWGRSSDGNLYIFYEHYGPGLEPISIQKPSAFGLGGLLKSHATGLRLVRLLSYRLSFVHDSTPVESLTILIASKFTVVKHFTRHLSSLFDSRLEQFIRPNSAF